MDASVASLSRYPFNATARYRCAAGFAMQGGSTVRTCAVSGRWTGTAPRCQREPGPGSESSESTRTQGQLDSWSIVVNTKEERGTD